jgi:hypothetical protein
MRYVYFFKNHEFSECKSTVAVRFEVLVVVTAEDYSLLGCHAM